MANQHIIQPLERNKYKNSFATEFSKSNASTSVNEHVSKTSLSLKYGILAGTIVGIYQWLLNAQLDQISIGKGILGFLLMTPIIWYAVRKAKNYYSADSFFKNAAVISMYLAFYAGITTAAVSMMGYAIGFTTHADIVSVDGVSFFRIMVNSVFQIFVGTVIGNCIAFIFMQGYKSGIPADEFK